MENKPDDPNSPQNLNRLSDFLLHGTLTRLNVALQVHQELLCTLLAKDPSILQGKEPRDYIESKIQEKLNVILAGAADIDPRSASALANLLMPKKQDKPPES